MYSKPRTDLELETGHILFVDIVGFSKMPSHEQQESLHELSQIIRNTDAGKPGQPEEEMPRLSTGSGLALVFSTTAEAAVRCAMQTSKGSRTYPKLRLRIGIHSGPVNRLTEMNDRVGVAGPGVNIARRVTDCGDVGHILLSKYATEQLSDHWQWQPFLHEVGECEITADQVVTVVNFYTDDVGNPSLPKRFKRKHGHRSASESVRLSPIPAQNTLLTILFFSVVAIAIGYWVMFPPTSSDSTKSHSGPEVQVLKSTPRPRTTAPHP